ncbi:hypothetical protein Dimus_039244 [Dionaea muscipula]
MNSSPCFCLNFSPWNPSPSNRTFRIQIHELDAEAPHSEQQIWRYSCSNTIRSRISHNHSKSFLRVQKSVKQTEVLNFITEVNLHDRQLIHNSLKNIQVIRNWRRIIIPQ